MASKAQETIHGRYVIRTMNVAGEWRSRAFHRMNPIGDIKAAATPQESIFAVKAVLDSVDADNRAKRGADGFPTAHEVRAALAAISISQGQWDMLQAHRAAPNQTLTATQLAAAAGYKDFGAANLQYGLLARTLAEEMGWTPAAGPDGEITWTYALATDAHSNEKLSSLNASDLPEWQWKLRPEIAEALS